MAASPDDADVRRLGSDLIYEDNWMRLRRDQIERRDGSRGTYASSRRPTSRSSSRPRTTVSISSRNSGTRSGGAPGRSRRAGSGRADGPPEDLARLELLQETGLRARHLARLGFLHCAHGTTNQGAHYFLATGLEAGEPEREHEEQDMRQDWVPRARLEDMIRQGVITDDSTVAAYTLLLLSERFAGSS